MQGTTYREYQAARMAKSAGRWMKTGLTISIIGTICIILALIFATPVYWSGYLHVPAMQTGILIQVIGIPTFVFGVFQHFEAKNR